MMKLWFSIAFVLLAIPLQAFALDCFEFRPNGGAEVQSSMSVKNSVVVTSDQGGTTIILNEQRYRLVFDRVGGVIGYMDEVGSFVKFDDYHPELVSKKHKPIQSATTAGTCGGVDMGRFGLLPPGSPLESGAFWTDFFLPIFDAQRDFERKKSQCAAGLQSCLNSVQNVADFATTACTIAKISKKAGVACVGGAIAARQAAQNSCWGDYADCMAK